MLPEKMLKIEVAVVKSMARNVVRELHELGAVHIEYVEDEEGIRNSAPLEDIDELSRRARVYREVRSTSRELGVADGGSSGYRKGELEKIVEEYRELRGMEDETARIMQDVEHLAVLIKLGISVLPKSASIACRLFETVPEKIEKIALECNRKGLDCEYRREKGKAWVFIAGAADDADLISGIAKEFALLPIRIEFGGDWLSPKEEYEMAVEKSGELKRRVGQAKGRMKRRLSEIMGKVRHDYSDVEAALQRAEIVSKFGESEALYFIRGWIIAKEKEKVEKRLGRHRPGIEIVFSPPAHGELAPTSLKSSEALKPFENMLKFISSPRSDEIDPTKITAITLPIMFGMIVGDFGYSLVLLLIASHYRKKLKGILGAIMGVTFYSAFWGMLWGLVFSEFFGFELEYTLMGVAMPLVSRLHGVMMLLGLAVAVGAIHIGLGNALGAIHGIMHRNVKHAIAKICWVTLELGIIGLLISADAGIAVIILSVIGILATEGIIGVIEMPGLLGSIMSYARIAAVGLSGVILAMLINMVRPDPSQGIFMVVVLIFYLFAHFFAMCLAAFEALIQGGRLHAVEFYSKFYKGGGIMFNPFRMKEKEVE